METLLITVSIFFVVGLVWYYRWQRRVELRRPMVRKESEDPFRNYPVGEFEE